LPVKTLIPATKTATAKAAIVRLTYTTAWALDGEKLQLFGHIPSFSKIDIPIEDVN
jgi:hypothetical protein